VHHVCRVLAANCSVNRVSDYRVKLSVHHVCRVPAANSRVKEPVITG
jgi:hypothetical protein